METSWVRCAISVLAAIVLNGRAVASDVTVGNYGIGRTAVSYAIDAGERQQVAYGQFVAATIGNGSHRIAAYDAAGNAIATASWDQSGDDRINWFFAGDGSAEAPYEWRYEFDHTRPITNGAISIQTIDLVPLFDANRRPQSLYVDTTCRTTPGKEMRYRQGSYVDSNGSEASSVFELSTTGCGVALLDGAGRQLASTALPTAAGTRVRVVLHGNGTTLPFVISVIDQGREPTVAIVRPTSGIDGFWYAPGRPNIGLRIGLDRTRSDGSVVGVVYGFDAGGAPIWNVLRGDAAISSAELQQVRLLRPARAASGAVRYTGAGAGTLEVHSCNALTLELGPETIVGGKPMPRSWIRFVKLVPSDC